MMRGTVESVPAGRGHDQEGAGVLNGFPPCSCPSSPSLRIVMDEKDCWGSGRPEHLEEAIPPCQRAVKIKPRSHTFSAEEFEKALRFFRRRRRVKVIGPP